MKNEYDFSQSVKNPYIKKLKKQVTIRLEEDVVSYFKELAEDTGISYQSLINLYLQDCVKAQRKPSLEWMREAKKRSMVNVLIVAAHFSYLCRLRAV